MAVTVPDIDVKYATQGHPSVSYQAGDWVVFLGIITGNTPTGSPTNITITSAGGGSMGIIFSDQEVNDRFVLATLKMTDAGTTTWSISTIGNVAPFVWREEGALVLRGVDTIGLYDWLYFGSSAGSEGPDADFDRTVDINDSYGQLALLHGYARHLQASPGGEPELSFVSGPSPATPTDVSPFDNRPGIGTETADAWIGVDLTFDQNWYIDTPPVTDTYTVTHHVTHYDSPFESSTVGVVSRFGAWPMVVVELEEEAVAYWGIDARLNP